MPKSASSIHLDAVRGLAALAVFCDHWRNLFFVNYEAASRKGPFIRALYALTGLGHEAVMIFFVLSGYFISTSVMRAEREKRWSWKWYARQRLTRLYVVLLPALLLTALLDHTGIGIAGAHGVYGAAPDYRSMMPVPVSARSTPGIWLGNLLFLQSIRVPAYGTNGPLWSLSYEFWYYLLFPLGLLALSRRRPLPTRIGCLALAAVTLAFVGPEIALYLLVWLMGYAVGMLKPIPSSGRRLFGGISIGALCLSLIAVRFQVLHEPHAADLLVALSFAAALYSLLNAEQRMLHPVYVRCSESLSGMSYTLYLTHVPLLVFLNALIIRQHRRWQPDLLHLSLALLLAMVVLMLIRGFWFVTEAQTESLRRFSATRWRPRAEIREA